MISIWLQSLPVLIILATVGWGYAARRHNVNIVDSLWSLFFLVAVLVYARHDFSWDISRVLVCASVCAWAVRLSLHLAIRNAGKREDRRYAAMRSDHPNFNLRSLVSVFWLQAILAWLISAPLAAALTSQGSFGIWHWMGLALFLTGFMFESIADFQLDRFKAKPTTSDQVLDTGLWRYSRHPNYFGEAVLWWGFFLYAVPSGELWTLFSPVLMTWLLLRVSGVTLLEKDIHERRPAYRQYIESTSAFFPMPPRAARTSSHRNEVEPK